MQSFFNVLHCHPGVNIRRFSTMQKKKTTKKPKETVGCFMFIKRKYTMKRIISKQNEQ